MAALTWVMIRLNTVAGVLFSRLHAPLAVLPPWLSLAVISAVLGVLMLVVFKYTSNQAAIGHIRDRIKAHLLSMRLFRDHLPVVLTAQIKILGNAFLLLVHSVVPVLVMGVPFTLLFGQLGLWYQSRPLMRSETAVVVLQLAGSAQDPVPPVVLEPSDAAAVTIGPVHVPSKQQVCWQIQAQKDGRHQLTFQVAGNPVRKELVISRNFMAVSTTRPAMNLLGLVCYPAEPPFDKNSPIQSIHIDYPDRSSHLAGTGTWVISFFAISMATAFLCKSVLNVKL